MLNDLVRENPAVALVVLVAAVALAAWALQRTIARLDKDISGHGTRIAALELEVAALKLEVARNELTVRHAMTAMQRHMEAEEKSLWPAIMSSKDENIKAHAVLGERLTRVETLMEKVVNGGSHG